MRKQPSLWKSRSVGPKRHRPTLAHGWCTRTPLLDCFFCERCARARHAQACCLHQPVVHIYPGGTGITNHGIRPPLRGPPHHTPYPLPLKLRSGALVALAGAQGSAGRAAHGAPRQAERESHALAGSLAQGWRCGTRITPTPFRSRPVHAPLLLLDPSSIYTLFEEIHSG